MRLAFFDRKKRRKCGWWPLSRFNPFGRAMSVALRQASIVTDQTLPAPLNSGALTSSARIELAVDWLGGMTIGRDALALIEVYRAGSLAVADALCARDNDPGWLRTLLQNLVVNQNMLVSLAEFIAADGGAATPSPADSGETRRPMAIAHGLLIVALEVERAIGRIPGVDNRVRETFVSNVLSALDSGAVPDIGRITLQPTVTPILASHDPAQMS